MSIFDRLSSMARSATDKASDTLEISRINSRINAERTRVESIKTRIGDYYWQKHLLGEETDSPTFTFCQEIAALEDIIEDLQNQIHLIRERTAVPEAPASVAPETVVPVAGDGDLVDPPSVVSMEAETILCPACRTQNFAGPQFKFCAECGTRLPQPTMEAPVAPKPKGVAADEHLVVPRAQEGAKLMVCLSCGATLQQGAKTCDQCGTKV